MIDLLVPVEDSSQVGQARRSISRLGSLQNLSEEEVARASLIVTELGTNLLSHAGKGELILRGHDGQLDVISIDKGPGIIDLSRAFEDGFSSSGTPGNGFGAIRRKSDRFDIFSEEGKGTVIAATVCKAEAKPLFDEQGAINLPYPGEIESGDNWSFKTSSQGSSLVVIDGLGHGVFAAQAANKAVEVFQTDDLHTPSEYIARAHEKLKGGRGAALAYVKIDTEAKKIIYSGVGNISGFLAELETSKGLVSHNGTVGVQLHRVDQLEYAWNEQTLLILHSDGLSNRWSFKSYPGLFAKSPLVICGVLYRDFCRGRDDVTIVVTRLSKLRKKAA